MINIVKTYCKCGKLLVVNGATIAPFALTKEGRRCNKCYDEMIVDEHKVEKPK